MRMRGVAWNEVIRGWPARICRPGIWPTDHIIAVHARAHRMSILSSVMDKCVYTEPITVDNSNNCYTLSVAHFSHIGCFALGLQKYLKMTISNAVVQQNIVLSSSYTNC